MLIVVSVGQSIQAALDAARPGDTVSVREGEYAESVTIGPGKDHVRLLGAGAGRTVLCGDGMPEAVGITVEAQGVTVAGLTVRGFEAGGIRVLSDDNILQDNEVRQNGETGIDLRASRTLVRHNTVVGNAGHGIKVTGAGNYLIGNRVAHNDDHGIDVQLAAVRTLALQNDAFGNGVHGISVQGGGSWVVANRCRTNQGSGIDLHGVENVLVYGNTSTGNACGLEADAVGVMALRNKLVGNQTTGILVALGPDTVAERGLTESLLYANTVSHNGGHGVRGRGEVVDSVFFANTVSHNEGDGVDLDGGDGNRVVRNEVGQNRGCGIELDRDADRNVVDDNKVAANAGLGIRVDTAANDNAVRGNDVFGHVPFDIVVDPPAINNAVERNRCERSSPAQFGD